MSILFNEDKMKKYLQIIIFVVFLIFSYSSFGKDNNGGQEVIKNILANKTAVLFKETEGFGIIAGSIFIKGGSIEDPKGKKGLTNLTFKMALKGTKNYNFISFNKLFEDSGGYISASVAEEYSIIEFALRVEDLEEGLKRIKDMLLNPVFPEDKLEQEKQNTIAQIIAKKEEGFSYAFDELRKIIYKDTPYQYPVLGEVSDVKTISKKDIQKRWNELMESSRFVVSFVGDVSYSKVENLIKDTFGSLKNKKDYKFPVYNYEIGNVGCKTVKREGAQSTILYAYNAPSVKDKEYFAMKVLNGVLGSGFTSRLFQELREKRGLAYAVASFFPTRINMGRLFAYIGTAPEKTEESVEGIKEVVNSISKGVSDEEIQIAKEKIVGHFLLDHQTRAKQSWYLGWFETVGLGYKFDKLYVDYINKVNKNDILEAWKNYIPKGYACVIVKP